MAAKLETLSVGVLHGPSLNLLGQREPDVYGGETLEAIDKRISDRASELGVDVDSFQSNAEGAIVDWIHTSGGRRDGLLVNGAAFTHTSVAIRDALLAVATPFIEVHLTNVFAREPFRHHSYLSDIAIGQVAGFGGDSYILALEGLVGYLRRG